MRLAGWRRAAHKHSAETEPADGQGPKSGALHEGALTNLYGGAANWTGMPLCANSRHRLFPGLQHNAKACLAADHAIVSFLHSLERIDFIHRPDSGQCTELEGVLRIVGSAGIPTFD